MSDNKNTPPSDLEITPKAQEEIKNLKLELKLDQVTRGISVLNENQVQRLFNTTNRKWKYTRDGKAGQKWTYVKRGYVRRQLDSIFGFNWSFETKTPVLDALAIAEKTGSVVIEGRLTCVVLDERKQEIARMVKEDYGSASVKFEMTGTGADRRKKLDKDTQRPIPLDFGNDVKAARTDCFKRCAASLGIAADVYEKDEFLEISIIGADQESEKQDRTKKLLEKAKEQNIANQPGQKVGNENDKADDKR